MECGWRITDSGDRPDLHGRANLRQPSDAGRTAQAGLKLDRERVRSLMRAIGIEPIYPKPRLSVPGQGHKEYPYLLRDLEIDRSNQVLVHGHNLYSAWRHPCLPDCGDGLVEPLRDQLAAEQ